MEVKQKNQEIIKNTSEKIINYYRTVNYERIDDLILKCYITVSNIEFNLIIPRYLNRSRTIRSKRNNQDLAKILKHYSQYNFHELTTLLKHTRHFVDIEEILLLDRERLKGYDHINIRIKDKIYLSLQEVIRIYDLLKEEKKTLWRCRE